MGDAALSQPLSGIDERNQERWLLVSCLRVYDAQNRRLLGHLVNVTTEGIMLLSESPLAVDQDYRLNMAVPLGDGAVEEIELEARSVWTKADEDPHFYNTGFQITDAPDESMETISALIEKLQQLQTPKYNPPDIIEE